MGRVYRLRTVPRWNSQVTGLSFWTTTLLLGSLTSLVSFYLTALYVINYQASSPMLAELEWQNKWVTLITPLTYLSLGLILIQALLTSNYLPEKSNIIKNIPGKHKNIASLRQWLLGLGGSGVLLSILFLHNTSPSISTIAILTIISWLCIVASETLGKTAFYEARRHPGLAYPELPWSSSSHD
jgi:DMSO reductase anchor subunit